MEWRTKITEMFGCKYPILEGAFAGFGTWPLAAAVAEAGAHGCITASASRTPEKLREDIKRCRDATDGSFGVNLSFGMCPQIEEMLEVCIEERVPIETAAYKPDSLATRIKESGLKWIHKTSLVKDALHAEKLGVDAVIVVGLEGTGFKSPNQLTTMLTTIWGKRQLKVPFIAAGGIADANGFLAALAMGADAVMMGTAFMITKECPLSNNSKEGMARISPDNPKLRHRVLGDADPKAYQEVVSMRDKIPLDQWLRKLESVHLKDPDWNKDVVGYPLEPDFDKEEPSKLVSLAVGMIDSVPTVNDLIQGIIHGAEEILDRRQIFRIR